MTAPWCTPEPRHRIPSALGGRARSTISLALLVSGLAQPLAWARDGGDHEKARAAVEAGQVLPLPTLLERLRRTQPGQILELELEREDGRWIYEVKLLQADGQLLKLEVDAATGQVLQVKRKDRSQDGSKDGRRTESDAGRKSASPKEATP